jgi:hypothetical protein
MSEEPLNDARVKERGPEPAAREAKPDPMTARGDLAFGFLGKGVGVGRHLGWRDVRRAADRTCYGICSEVSRQGSWSHLWPLGYDSEYWAGFRPSRSITPPGPVTLTS